MPHQIMNQANSSSQFKAKIDTVFAADGYMKDMVATIQNKGAISRDCRQSLRWIQLRPPVEEPPHKGPQKANIQKALGILGNVSGNVLARKAGTAPKPMRMTVGLSAETPCKAPDYIAQAMPSGAKTRALADVAQGDTLYIVGHSSAHGGSLSYKVAADPAHRVRDKCRAYIHKEGWHIDPLTLASLLINEGLPAGIKFDIALVACYSGGLANDALQTVQPLAQRVAASLAGRGYRCRVYGATGLTSSENNEVQVARHVEQQPDGKLLIRFGIKDVLRDSAAEQFYRRFFRAF